MWLHTCPYCGGSAHCDPDNLYYKRGSCTQCADCFAFSTAMDCHTYLLGPTLPTAARCHLTGYVIRAQ